VADDVVLIEPVSMIKFPANRAINREARRFWPFSDLDPKSLAKYQALVAKFPCAQNREFLQGFLGNLSSEQGVFPFEQRMMQVFIQTRAL
jgi:hypothetical protein